MEVKMLQACTSHASGMLMTAKSSCHQSFVVNYDTNYALNTANMLVITFGYSKVFILSAECNYTM